MADMGGMGAECGMYLCIIKVESGPKPETEKVQELRKPNGAFF